MDEEAMVDMIVENAKRSIVVLAGVFEDLGVGGVDAQALYIALRLHTRALGKRIEEELSPLAFKNLESLADELAPFFVKMFGGSIHLVKVD